MSDDRKLEELKARLRNLYSSDEFIAGEKNAENEAVKLKKELNTLEFEMMTPKQQLRHMIEKQLEADED